MSVYNSYIVNGVLQKTYIASVDGYKYHVAQGVKAFKSLTDAMAYCDRVMDLTGVVLTIK